MPSWLIADIMVGGGLATLKLNVALPGGTMSCARSVLYTPPGGGSPEYAMVWQDGSGSWLSVYYGPADEHGEELPVRLGHRLRRLRPATAAGRAGHFWQRFRRPVRARRNRSSCGASTRRATAARARWCSRRRQGDIGAVSSVVLDRSADIHLRRPDRGGDGPEAGRRRGLLLMQAIDRLSSAVE